MHSIVHRIYEALPIICGSNLFVRHVPLTYIYEHAIHVGQLRADEQMLAGRDAMLLELQPPCIQLTMENDEQNSG